MGGFSQETNDLAFTAWIIDNTQTSCGVHTLLAIYYIDKVKTNTVFYSFIINYIFTWKDNVDFLYKEVVVAIHYVT